MSNKILIDRVDQADLLEFYRRHYQHYIQCKKLKSTKRTRCKQFIRLCFSTNILVTNLYCTSWLLSLSPSLLVQTYTFRQTLLQTCQNKLYPSFSDCAIKIMTIIRKDTWAERSRYHKVHYNFRTESTVISYF